MATLPEKFHAAFGDPQPETPPGLRPETADPFWERWKKTTKAGWFAERFLYLFGPGLDRLDACLAAWPTLVPANPNRIILGHNAYGAIIVYENTDGVDNVTALNPLTRQYFSDPNLNFGSLIGSWLPDRRIPYFFDTSVYDAWRKKHGGEFLGERQILGIKKPLSHGGTMELDNFSVEDIGTYHQRAASGG